MGYIYLATPYSHDDPDVRHARFVEAERVAAALLQRGITVYSPIVHCHELANRYTLPSDFDFWQKHNECMLASAECLQVLTLPGWRRSKGVASEMYFARQRDIPTMLIHPEEFECLLPSV